jgi:hypothetical protein
MIDSDLAIVAILLFVVTAVLLMPPGPGTPLRAPVQEKS